MKKIFLCICLFPVYIFAQTSTLTVDKIMQDQKWIGTSPSNPYWSWDSKYLFFNWNPDKNDADSLYYITNTNHKPQKASKELKRYPSAGSAIFNSSKSAFAYESEGDIYFMDVKSQKEIRITHTIEAESAPTFISDTKLIYNRAQNLYSWDRNSGAITQLTNFLKGAAPKEEVLSAHEQWLRENQLLTSSVIRTRKLKKDSAEMRKSADKAAQLRTIYTGDKTLADVRINPGGRFVTYKLSRPVSGTKGTIVPAYVTESGFTQDINERSKVGSPVAVSEMYIYDRTLDTIIEIKTNALPGIFDVTDFEKEKLKNDTGKRSKARVVSFSNPSWNSKGDLAVIEIRSSDRKDRWLMKLDPENGKLTLIDRQRNEAWIGGPGINSPQSSAWINDQTIWFQSEATGYSHLYTADLNSLKVTPLTKGNYEILRTTLSPSKKSFYIHTNEIHPGEQHYYRLPLNAAPAKLTSFKGGHQVVMSPDEKYYAYLYSFSNKPWELYLQENKSGSKPVQITSKAASDEWSSYKWRVPELISYKARDGETVYARLYKPSVQHSSKPAVIFVHGAGYLQNAHQWWSSYSREYMFHNLLADLGYTVLDIDYRGSAGYGANWRTGIYRHMGGKDLDDHIDGAKLLVEKYNINPKNIGIYGGSYGGFITLMAMFQQPDVFAAGAALRSVTDWAHYNHGYTSNILNEPHLDSIAYRKSSPIYYAEGLQGALLMCHGMVDVNVHFQDIVRLTQRLIELKKENWELAVYPLEDHAFIEPSSWTDEYKRILKLFETNLKK